MTDGRVYRRADLAGDADGCAELWAAVVERAVLDARGLGVGEGRERRELEQDRARKFLLAGGGIAAVLAGLDENAVRSWAVKQAALGWPRGERKCAVRWRRDPAVPRRESERR